MDERKCLFCGKLFKPNSPKQTICKDNHYSKCPICGEAVLIKESYSNYIKNLETNGPRVCQKCRGLKIGQTRRNKSQQEKQQIVNKQKKTMIQRYGKDNAMKIEQFKEKALKTVQERYGVESNISQSEEIQYRIRKNSLNKYNVPHPAMANENREKMKQGMIKKYGDECPQRVPELRKKTVNTVNEKYGVDNVFQVEEFKKKQRESTKSRYGVEYSMQSEELRARSRKTNIEKYGAISYVQSDEYLSTLITDGSKIEEYRKFCSNERDYVIKNWPTSNPSLQDISTAVGISCDSVGERAIQHKFTDLISYNRSRMEDDIVNFISIVNPKLQIVRNSKSIISPYEIDIYLPELKFGIECNPTCTHNSSISDPWGGPPKSPSYHKHKTDKCIENQVELFHIFGYEWAYKSDIIKSMIKSRLGQLHISLYGRNCYVGDNISAFECKQFLDQCHRQGNAFSNIRIGLRDIRNDELVSVMTFSNTRKSIGKKDSDTEYTFELVRFCNKLNINVVGGASKLLKYFIKEYNPKKLVSFSDRAHTSGKLYEILGFKQVSISEPGYVWVNLKDDSYLTRVKCQKRNLTKVFEDVTEEDIQNKTEKQIMIEHGYVQVFDSGVIRWELNIE